MMRDDFCVFILTHGRPDRVHTLGTLMRAGYTGRVFIVIDDEDKTADQYRSAFGDRVLMFSKAEIAKQIDEGDNFNDRRAIIYARNACWRLARDVGCRYFMQLDDDYTMFQYRFDAAGRYGYWGATRDLDVLLTELVRFYETSGALSVAISQGGDHIGGAPELTLRRKAMNTFICSVDRPFQFFGRINEDVNTYVTLSRRGGLFLTVIQAQITHMLTQRNAGGMTELYLDSGTYLKTFYSVMYAPSCVTVSELRDPRRDNSRLHHRINWNAAAPKILNELHRKASQKAAS